MYRATPDVMPSVLLLQPSLLEVYVGENAELMEMAVLKQCFVAENLLYQMLLYSFYLLSYPWK